MGAPLPGARRGWCIGWGGGDAWEGEGDIYRMSTASDDIIVLAQSFVDIHIGLSGCDGGGHLRRAAITHGA